MTRVNVVPVEELCDKHLLAECREIPRIPNAIVKGRAKVVWVPGDYRLGKGHVQWFYRRTQWLKSRYDMVHSECVRRGFSVRYRWPDIELDGDYQVTDDALSINRQRIEERMPIGAKFTNGG